MNFKKHHFPKMKQMLQVGADLMLYWIEGTSKALRLWLKALCFTKGVVSIWLLCWKTKGKSFSSRGVLQITTQPPHYPLSLYQGGEKATTKNHGSGQLCQAITTEKISLKLSIWPQLFIALNYRRSSTKRAKQTRADTVCNKTEHCSWAVREATLEPPYCSRQGSCLYELLIFSLFTK